MASIAVDARILEDWARSAADGFTGLDLILTSNCRGDDVIGAIHDAVDAIVAEHNDIIDADQPTPGAEPPYPGEWHAIEVEAGRIALKVIDCDGADVALPAIVEALERHGISGTLERHTWPPAPAPPPRALVLEGRMLVRGRRSHYGRNAYVTEPDPRVLDGLLDLSARWLCADSERSTPVLKVSVLPAFSLRPDEDISVRLSREVGSSGILEVRVATDAGFRILVWHPNHSQVGLIEAIGRDAAEGGWRDPLRRMRSTLVDAGRFISYGYIKRGSSPAIARNGHSLAEDWPVRVGHGAREIRRARTTAFYDEYLADAFGIQLLGPGYAGRIPETTSYRAEAVGDATLLEHLDPESWYEHPFVDPGAEESAIARVPPPAVLAEARAELAPILFRPEVIPDA